MIDKIKNELIELENYIHKIIVKECFSKDLVVEREEDKRFRLLMAVKEIDKEYEDWFYIEDRKEIVELINKAFRYRDVVVEINIIYQNIFYPYVFGLRRLLNEENKLEDIYDIFNELKKEVILNDFFKEMIYKEKEVHIQTIINIDILNDVMYFEDEVDKKKYKIIHFAIEYLNVHKFIEVF